MAEGFKTAETGHAAGDADAVSVDPRAEVHPRAEIGPGCEIGPLAVIGPDVRLGAGCQIRSHAVLEGPLVMGPRNVVHPFACIGGAPQDLRHRGESTRLEIGRGNSFREYVTISRGTAHGGGVTRIGDFNLVMAYCHIAHDCVLGDHIVMANQATLAGHVLIEDHAVFGGLVAVGTFLRIGESAMLAAGAMVERDVPPFCLVAGDRARLRAVNRVGLDRRGIGRSAREQIKSIFRELKLRRTPIAEIVAGRSDRDELTAEACRLLDFLATAGRGITR